MIFNNLRFCASKSFKIDLFYQLLSFLAFLEFFLYYNDKIQASCESYHQNKQGLEVFKSFIDFYIMSQNVNFCVTQ